MSTNNVRFFWQNLFDAATLSVNSTGAADLAAANLQERHYTKPYRSAGCATEWVKWDLGTAQAITAFLLRGHNLTTGATVKVQANASDVWTAPSLDLTITITQAMVDENLLAYNWTSGQTYRYWRLYIEDASNPDGYIELGRIFCGPYSSPDRHISAEYSWEQPSTSTIKSSSKGQKWVALAPFHLIFAVKFDDFGTADLAIYEAMRKRLGDAYAFFFCDDPTNLVTRTFYVSCSSGWKITHVHGGICYSLELTLEEER